MSARECVCDCAGDMSVCARERSACAYLRWKYKCVHNSEGNTRVCVFAGEVRVCVFAMDTRLFCKRAL